MRVTYKILCLMLVILTFECTKLSVSGQDDSEIQSGDNSPDAEFVSIPVEEAEVEPNDEVEDTDTEVVVDETAIKPKINGKSARAGNYFMDEYYGDNVDFGTPNNDMYNWSKLKNTFGIVCFERMEILNVSQI